MTGVIATEEEERLSLDLQLIDERHQELLSEEKVRQWVQATLAEDVSSAEIAVRIVDAQEGQSLNRDYRAKDYATNVLTFDYAHAPNVMADLVICAPVVAQEALDQGKALEAHYAHMIVHGVLHAQGWDHEEEEEAQAMEQLETGLMLALGFAAPYEGGK